MNLMMLKERKLCQAMFKHLMTVFSVKLKLNRFPN